MPSTPRTSKGLPRTAHPAAKDKPVRSVAFVSLGCPKNLVDSEKMLGLLAEDGLAVVSADAERGGADAIVINTCGFLEASKDESLEVIHEAIRAKEAGKVRRVVVAGCLVQRHRAKMLEWAPGIDALVGVFDRDKIVEAVRGSAPARERLADRDAPKYWIAGNALVAAKERGLKTTGLTVNGKDGTGIGYFEDDSARLRITPRHYAYLRVSEGCNQNCAFCTIPSIRGKMRSKPLDRVAAEARELMADGAFELNLIGQDTTSYGDDIGAGMAGGGGLPALLRAVSETIGREGGAGGGWVRLMYAYPSNFSDACIDAIAELNWLERSGGRGGFVLPYIDIPLQHASDAVLTSMRRNVSARQQRDLLVRLRRRVPGIAIRTTFISGFPGETEDDHKRLLEFVGEMNFENMGVFEYSHEEGTVAGTMEEDPALAVPDRTKARRREELMSLQQKIAFARNAAMAAEFDEKRPAAGGRQLDVLIDQSTRTRGRKTAGVGAGGGLYIGRTYFQAPQIDGVTFVHSSRDLSPGELVRCVIVGSDGYDLVARPVDELERRMGLKVLSARG
ncbi:MAG: 30S ribosomal protein S12 methylthiotransferase RimO [Phycisphaeraceae bacterium]|nr:30S ribosomal protein S12 methylthiotransferase RimO [Phycisphaeraceae bacterium]